MQLKVLNRRTLFFGGFALVVAGGAGLVGREYLLPANAAKPVVFTGLVEGVGAGGYDAVAYHTEKRAVKGDAAITVDWNGATWRFASAANRDLFKADPARYAPQFGGYCAWAVAEGYTAKGDPEQWSLVGDKLYLNYDRRIKARWEKDIPGNIAKGDANWPKITSQ